MKGKRMGTDDEPTKAAAGAVATEGEAAGEESDEVLRRLDEKLAARIRDFRESERLSEADFAIRINVRE